MMEKPTTQPSSRGYLPAIEELVDAIKVTGQNSRSLSAQTDKDIAEEGSNA
jgi:hypothetical protein